MYIKSVIHPVRPFTRCLIYSFVIFALIFKVWSVKVFFHYDIESTFVLAIYAVITQRRTYSNRNRNSKFYTICHLGFLLIFGGLCLRY